MKIKDRKMEKRLQEIKKLLIQSFHLEHFIQLTDFLTEIVTKEIRDLKMFQIEEIKACYNVKQEACNLYTQMIKSLKENPEYLNNLKVQERNVLKNATENLSKLLDQNAKMSQIFNQTNQKVIKIFQEVVKSRAVTPFNAAKHLHRKGDSSLGRSN